MKRYLTTKEKVAFVVFTAITLPLFALWLHQYGVEPFYSSWKLGAASGMLLALPPMFLLTKSGESKLMAGVTWAGVTIPWILSAWPVVSQTALTAMVPGIACGAFVGFAFAFIVTLGLGWLFEAFPSEDEQKSAPKTGASSEISHGDHG